MAPSSASPVTGAILSAGGPSLIGATGTTTNHPLDVAGLSNARMAVTSAVVRPPGSPTTSVSPSQGHPPPSAGGPAAARCCDTGRPIFTDPLTGQTVCSCQYELLGSYQRLGGLPTAALSMYSAPYAAAAAAAASEGMAAYFPSLGAEQAPFYTPTVSNERYRRTIVPSSRRRSHGKKWIALFGKSLHLTERNYLLPQNCVFV